MLKKSHANSSAFPTCNEDPGTGDQREQVGESPRLMFFHLLLGSYKITKIYFDFTLTSQENYRKQVDLFYLFIKDGEEKAVGLTLCPGETVHFV